MDDLIVKIVATCLAVTAIQLWQVLMNYGQLGK